jgi:ribonuclease HI
MGNSTNNAAEFGALELGLEILSRERMTNTIMEGDSTLVINTVKILQNGTRVGKVQDTGALHTPYIKSRSI